MNTSKISGATSASAMELHLSKRAAKPGAKSVRRERRIVKVLVRVVGGEIFMITRAVLGSVR